METVDGTEPRLYEDGQRVASTPCSVLSPAERGTISCGTEARGQALWGGRLDELALYYRALSRESVSIISRAVHERSTETT